MSRVKLHEFSIKDRHTSTLWSIAAGKNRKAELYAFHLQWPKSHILGRDDLTLVGPIRPPMPVEERNLSLSLPHQLRTLCYCKVWAGIAHAAPWAMRKTSLCLSSLDVSHKSLTSSVAPSGPGHLK